MRLPALLTAAGLTAVALAVGVSGPAAGTAAAAEPASGTLRARVAALQAEVDRAGDRLAAGAGAYEAASRRLAVLTQQQFAVASELDRQDGLTSLSRSGVSALVRAAYKGGGLPPAVSALLSGDPRALADLDHLRRTVGDADTSRRTALADLTLTRSRTAGLLERKAALRRQALTEQQAVDERQRQVSAQAADLAQQLTATAAALQTALAREAETSRRTAAARAAEAARLAAARAAAVTGYAVPGQATSYVPGAVTPSRGGGCAPAAPHGYANGFLPAEVLCPLPGRPDQRLRTDAAQSFSAMDAARVASGLPALCLTDTYRDYAGQVDVFARKPGLAAVPGRSQHGWGLAIDFCGGVERFDGEAHLWLKANAARFGWVHPAWAEPGGSRPEAWHWEFQG